MEEFAKLARRDGNVEQPARVGEADEPASVEERHLQFRDDEATEVHVGAAVRLAQRTESPRPQTRRRPGPPDIPFCRCICLQAVLKLGPGAERRAAARNVECEVGDGDGVSEGKRACEGDDGVGNIGSDQAVRLDGDGVQIRKHRPTVVGAERQVSSVGGLVHNLETRRPCEGTCRGRTTWAGGPRRAPNCAR